MLLAKVQFSVNIAIQQTTRLAHVAALTNNIYKTKTLCTGDNKSYSRNT